MTTFKITINIMLLTAFYTVVGGLLSYVMYYIFDEFNDDWKKRSLAYQIYDIFVELSLVSVATYWVSDFVRNNPPIFGLNKKTSDLIEGYVAGIFFAYAMFVFLDDLTEKIKHVHDTELGGFFDKYFPNEGSILDFSLRYGPRKTDETKKED